jgi:hypothetical protein
MFVTVFLLAFILSAIILHAIVSAFMRLMGADLYFFNLRLRVIICAVIAFIAACCTLPG